MSRRYIQEVWDSVMEAIEARRDGILSEGLIIAKTDIANIKIRALESIEKGDKEYLK